MASEATGAWGLAAQGIQDTLGLGLNYLVDRPYNAGREDTAVQRRVADLRAAGINPILAAGQAAASQPNAGERPQGAPSIGELIQLQAAKSDIAKTKAETQLIQTQRLREEAETRSTNIYNDFHTERNPLTLRGDQQTIEQRDMQIKFDEQMNPVRFKQAVKELTGQELQNEIARNESQLQKLGIDVRQLEIESEKLKLSIAREYGMSNAEADNYLKKAAVWTANNERERMVYMNKYVYGSASSFNNPDGTGPIGQVKQLANILNKFFEDLYNLPEFIKGELNKNRR